MLHSSARQYPLPLALVLLAAFPSVGSSQILDVRDLKANDIKALDRQRTVVILQGGILEEHGPYLPIYADGWLNEYTTRHLAESVVARPGWTVLIFPVIPLGSGGANELGQKRPFPGTFAIRPATLRSIYMDLADELGKQGFRWVFLMNAHGAPSHSRALFDACDYFRDIHGQTMVHVWGLTPIAQWFQDARQLWSEANQRENGFLVHADMLETSLGLYLRPLTVTPTFTSAPSITVPTMADVVKAARHSEWPGYVGAPRLATAALGAQALRDVTSRIAKLAGEILDGAEPRRIGRFVDVIKGDPEQAKVDAAADAYDAAMERTQADWLRKRGK